MLIVFYVAALAMAALIPGIPGFVIAQRSGVSYPGLAFIPFVGLWIVLFETMRRSGWLGLLALIPSLGYLVVSIWAAIRVPQHHSRSQWWTAALILPLLNIFGYWVYALTLRAPYERTLVPA